MEISIVDVLLFAWGAIATTYAIKFREEVFMQKFLVHKMLTDKTVRDTLVHNFDTAVKNATP